MLIDPYRNQYPDRFWFEREFPAVDCDLCLVTHAHFDHDAVPGLVDDVSIWRMAGNCSDLRGPTGYPASCGGAAKHEFPLQTYSVPSNVNSYHGG